jgi:hypothetical protein
VEKARVRKRERPRERKRERKHPNRDLKSKVIKVIPSKESAFSCVASMGG